MATIRSNPVKQTLDAGGTIYSSSVRLTDPGLCEILGYAGFDFVLLDGEHGAIDPSSIDRLVQGCYAGGTLPVVAWTGAITALVAAFIALGQYDLKRILAYSTVSQLGLMMVGLGVAGVSVGMFHLLTHAFFKALLFLGAGSIIHGCHEEQDIRKMGGLAKPMPVTTIAYLCGTLALVAFPFTSGFFSKDEILASSWAANQPIFWIAAAASLLTAVYMTRQCLYVFTGAHRGEHAPHDPALAGDGFGAHHGSGVDSQAGRVVSGAVVVDVDHAAG
mgnify:CR=1 FL=1